MEKQQLVKSNIVALGAELFAQKGLAGTSVDTVIKTIGIGKSQFYSQFRSKTDLISEVVKVQLQNRTLYNPPQIRTLADLHQWLRDVQEEAKDSYFDNGCPIINLIGQLPAEEDRLRAELKESLSGWEKEIHQIFALLQKTGEVSSQVAPDILAAATQAAIFGGFSRAKHQGSRQGLKQAIDGLISLIGSVGKAPPSTAQRIPTSTAITDKLTKSKKRVTGFCP